MRKGRGSIRKHAANKRVETERASANAKWERCRARATKRRREPATKGTDQHRPRLINFPFNR